MLINHSFHYWEYEFDITMSDVERISALIKELNLPASIVVLARRIIRGRIRYGQDISPSAITEWAGKRTVQLWDPAGKWSVGDGVVVVRNNDETDQYETYVGYITSLEPQLANIEINHEEIAFMRAEPGSNKAQKWHALVREVVAQKIKSAEIDDQVTAVLAQFGDRIISRLVEVLEHDQRFIGFDNQWFLTELIDPLPISQVRSIYKKLIELRKPQQLGALKAFCDPQLSEDVVSNFILLQGLEEHPKLFQKNTVGNHTTWIAILPELDQIQTHRFAYDPDTYEIISTPGRKLNTQTSLRLQELGLFAHVIELGDEF